MLIEEAKWFANQILALPIKKVSPILNIGCASYFTRAVERPWTQKYLYNILKKRGIKIINADVSKFMNPDIILDICNLENIPSLPYYRSIMATNLLEHVSNPYIAAKNILKLTPIGGYIFISVPYKIPYHLAPIDNMLRILPDEIHKLFPATKVIEKKLIDGETYLQHITFSPCMAILHLATFYFRIYNVKKIYSKISFFCNILKPMSVSVCIFQKL